MSRAAALVLGVALGVRLLTVFAFDRNVGDVRRYHMLAEHVLDVSPDPYQAPRLYPYPPVWVGFEAAAEALARRGLGPFPVLVKLPVVGAELWIVWLLWRRARRGRLSAWVYALHPAAILIGGAHGQFDALALALLLFGLDAHARGRLDASALSVGAAIAVKSFPVLLLPFALLAVEGPLLGSSRRRYLALALGPLVLLLLPFALHDFGALRRELFGYAGVADFGWIGVMRGLRWFTGDGLARSEARHWPEWVSLAKAAFLLFWTILLLATARGRRRFDLVETTLAVFLGFQVLYGALSVQYVLWVVVFGAWRPGRWFAAHTAATLLALPAFYLFLSPGVLWPEPLTGAARHGAGSIWVLGSASLLVVSAGWLISVLRGGRDSAAA